MDNLLFVKEHNVIAFLDDAHPKIQEGYADVFRFLRRSHIGYAISAECIVYENLIREFWGNIRVDDREGVSGLVTTIQENELIINEEVIRRVLRFNDADGVVILDLEDIQGTCVQIGYEGDFPKKMVKKSRVSFNWRYIMHILIMCISSRKGGFDELSQRLSSAFVCLVTERVFNFSKYIYDMMKNMVEETTQKKKFLLYPRFCQLIINHELQNSQLRLEGNVLELQQMGWIIMTNMKKEFKSSMFSKTYTPLLPHMIVNDEPHQNLQPNVLPQQQPEPQPHPEPVHEPHQETLPLSPPESVLEPQQISQQIFEQPAVVTQSQPVRLITYRRQSPSVNVLKIKDLEAEIEQLKKENELLKNKMEAQKFELIKSKMNEVGLKMVIEEWKTKAVDVEKVDRTEDIMTDMNAEIEVDLTNVDDVIGNLVKSIDEKLSDQSSKESEEIEQGVEGEKVLVEESVENVEQEVEEEGPCVGDFVESGLDVFKSDIWVEENVEKVVMEDIGMSDEQKHARKKRKLILDVNEEEVDEDEIQNVEVNMGETQKLIGWIPEFGGIDIDDAILIEDDDEEDVEENVHDERVEIRTDPTVDAKPVVEPVNQPINESVTKTGTGEGSENAQKSTRKKSMGKKSAPNVIIEIKQQMRLWKKSMDTNSYKRHLKNVLIKQGGVSARSAGQMKLDTLENRYVDIKSKQKLEELKKRREETSDERDVRIHKELLKEYSTVMSKKNRPTGNPNMVSSSTPADLVKEYGYDVDEAGKKEIDELQEWLDNTDEDGNEVDKFGFLVKEGSSRETVTEKGKEKLPETRIVDSFDQIADSRKINGWRYDAYKNRIVIKKGSSSCTYIYKSEDLMRLSKEELIQLSKLKMINHGLFPLGTEIEQLVKEYVRTDFAEFGQKGKRKRKTILLDTLPTPKLKKMKLPSVVGWRMDLLTEEMVIERVDGSENRVYEDSEVKELCEEDILALYQLPFRDYEQSREGRHFMKLILLNVYVINGRRTGQVVDEFMYMQMLNDRIN